MAVIFKHLFSGLIAMGIFRIIAAIVDTIWDARKCVETAMGFDNSMEIQATEKITLMWIMKMKLHRFVN